MGFNSGFKGLMLNTKIGFLHYETEVSSVRIYYVVSVSHSMLTH